jgi:HEAT repeat protein
MPLDCQLLSYVIRRTYVGMVLSGLALLAAAGCQSPTASSKSERPGASPAAAQAPAPPARAPQVDIDSLSDPNPAMRMLAAVELAKLGPKAKPALHRLVEVLQHDDDATVRFHAAGALGAIGPEARAAAGPLIEALEKDPDASVRGNAASALGSIVGRLADAGADTQPVIRALSRALRDPSAYVRKHAAKALQKIDPKKPRDTRLP